MQWTNEWIEKGRVEGALEGRRAVVARLLGRKFGKVSPEVQEHINRLTQAQLDDLAEAVLEFRDPGDVVAWVAVHT